MELEEYLNQQSEAGVYQSTGSFAIDFAKARKKRMSYSLPDRSLWIIRLLQGFSRLEAERVEICQDRHQLSITARLPDTISTEMSLSEVFRLPTEEDPRFPIQDAVWAAQAKKFNVTLMWREDTRSSGLRIEADSIETLEGMSFAPDMHLCFQVEPAENQGILHQLFGKVDFSGEFACVAQKGFLAPYPLFLDGRPYDFETSVLHHQLDQYEFRAHPAQSGPRIQVSPKLVQRVEFLDSEIDGLTGNQRADLERFDYLFLIATEWAPHNQKRPLVHWVDDGFVLQTEELRDWESPLSIELFLPAGGLQTDLSRLRFVRDKYLTERLHHFEKLACYSFFTTPPYLGGDLSEASLAWLQKSIERFYEEVKSRKSFLEKEKRRFKNATKNYKKRAVWHQNRLEKILAAGKKPVNKRSQTVTISEHERRSKQRAASVSRWSQFLKDSSGGEVETPKVSSSVARPLNDNEVYLPDLEEFFGGTYIRLPRREVAET